MASGYLSPQQVSERWSVDTGTVLRLIRTGKLEAFKIGRLWRISPDALKRYEEANRRVAPAPILPRSQRRIVTRIS